MKKIIIIFSFFMLIKSPCAISASSYIVMDSDTNNVIMGQNIHDKRLIASISKIMSCIVALENGDLDKKITADKRILKAVGSSIYIEIGETMTLNDLLYGMMLRSGNDAALLVAIATSDEEENFVKLMNKKAKELGMNNTYFINPHGLENEEGIGNTSTSYDMALLTSYAMQNKEFRKIFKTKNYNAASDKKKYSWTSKNKLLKYDYITGGKTGYTIKARRTLVSTASINDMNLVIVTLNDGNDFNDHIDLYQMINKKYSKKLILDKNNFKIMDDNIFIEDTFYIKKNYYMILENTKNISIKYYLDNNKNYSNNDVVGIVKVFQNNNEVYSEPIYIKKGKTKSNFFKKIFGKY